MRVASLIVLLFAAFPVTVWSGFSMLPGRTCPLATRDQLLACVSQMDANADDSITPEEIDAFTTAHAECIPTAVRTILTGANVITLCDTNADGNLTAADWSAPTGCIKARSRQMALCRACEKCGLFVLKK